MRSILPPSSGPRRGRLRRPAAGRAAILRARHPAHPHAELRLQPGRLPQGRRQRQRARQPRPDQLRQHDATARRAAHLRLVPGAAAAAEGVGRAGAADPVQGHERRHDRRSIPSEIQHAGGATLVGDLVGVPRAAEVAGQRRHRGRLGRARSAQQTGTGAVQPRLHDGAPRRRGAAADRRHHRRRRSRTSPPTSSRSLTKSCAFGTCHSGEQSDFFLTCQGDGSQRRHQVQLPRGAGLRRHSAGDVAAAAQAAGAVGRRHRAHRRRLLHRQERRHLEAALGVGDRGRRSSAAGVTLTDGEKFFDDYVMPVFLKRGCALEALPLAGLGQRLQAARRHPGLLLALLAALELRRRAPRVPRRRRARRAAEPPRQEAGGLGRRGRLRPRRIAAVRRCSRPGEVLDPALCPQPFPTDGIGVAVLHRRRVAPRERAALLTAGSADAMASGSTLPLVAVSRPPNDDRAIDFDTYRARRRSASSARVAVGALGAIDAASATVDRQPPRQLRRRRRPIAATSTCATRRSATTPRKVAFAMRLSATDTLDIYEVTLDAAPHLHQGHRRQRHVEERDPPAQPRSRCTRPTARWCSPRRAAARRSARRCR